jgi:hypothetical protein
MRLVICALAAASVATPAFAMLAPQYYERARDTAPDVVVFKVERVTGQRGADGYGVCNVAGKVETVERGAHYRAGGPVTVQVPCRFPGAGPQPSCVLFQTPAALRASKRARVWLERPGKPALDQYQTLS